MPPLDLVVDILLTVVVPGFLASVVICLLLLRWKMAGIGFLAGIVTANYFRNALSWSWHEDMGLFLTMLSIGCVVSALLVDNWASKLIVALALSCISAILFASDGAPYLHTLTAVTCCLLLFTSLRLAEKRLPPVMPACLLSVTGLATAIIMIHAHSARLSDLGLMCMASAAGITFISLLRRTSTHSLAAPAAVFFPYLLYYGQQNTFSEVPWLSFFALAAAPLSCLLLLLNNKRITRWLTAILWLLFLTLAVVVAMRYETVVMQ